MIIQTYAILGICPIITNSMIKMTIFYFVFGIKRANCINFQPEMASLPRLPSLCIN